MKEVHPDRLSQTLAKAYEFDIKALLSKAARLTKSNFGTLLQGSVVLFLTFVVLGVLHSNTLLSMMMERTSSSTNLLLKLPLYVSSRHY